MDKQGLDWIGKARDKGRHAPASSGADVRGKARNLAWLGICEEKPDLECSGKEEHSVKKIGRGRPRLSDEARAARKCSVEGCTRPYRTKGMCGLHYERMRSGCPLSTPVHRRDPKKVCNVEGCDTLVGRWGARGMCRSHYRRSKRAQKKRGTWVHQGKPKHLVVDSQTECKSPHCGNPADELGGHCSICDHMVRMGLPTDYKPGASRQ